MDKNVVAESNDVLIVRNTKTQLAFILFLFFEFGFNIIEPKGAIAIIHVCFIAQVPNNASVISS